MSTYKIEDSTKLQFSCLFVIQAMDEEDIELNDPLQGNEASLAPILKWGIENEYIEIDANNKYVAKSKGISALEKFVEKSIPLMEELGVYAFVDLEQGEFAWSRFEEFTDQEAWEDYIADEKWDDLRIAIAEFKGYDPIEIVFFDYLNNLSFEDFDSDRYGDYLLGEFWEEIESIINSSYHVDNLAYQYEEQLVTGKEVVTDMLVQGQELCEKLQAKGFLDS